MNLTWVATELRTGEIIADLPDLSVERVKRSLGRYEVSTGFLPIPTAPENWLRATLHGGTNLVLLAENPDDPAHGLPIWGGMVTRRTRGHGDTVTLSVATLEAYCERRYVGDQSFSGVGQNLIIQNLIDDYIADTAGIPLRVQFTTPGVGKLRDREYKDQDDMTVYSALQNLMGVIDGPEWTIEWEWQHDPERITPVLYVGDRIGVAAPDGLGPAATFELPGPVNEISLVEDFSDGKGANDVVATSSGQGDSKPQSPRQVVEDLERPKFEFRYTPSTSITEVDTLTDYAARAVTTLASGTSSVSLSAAQTAAPRLGVDWSIGDDVGYQIGGIGEDGRDTVPSFPNGFSGVARAIGWELTLGNTPILTPVLAGSEV